jgi:hypothetical protein
MHTHGEDVDVDTSHGAPGFTGSMLRVAWLSIGLGLVLEVTVLILAAGFGDLNKAMGEFLQKTSWWFLVCMGLAVLSSSFQQGDCHSRSRDEGRCMNKDLP